MSLGSLSISNFFRSLIFVISLLSFQAFAQMNNPHGSWNAPANKTMPVHAQGPICTDGQVYDFSNGTNAVYIGGQFTIAGRCSGNGVPITASQGRLTVPLENLALVDGYVRTSIPDGAGGWYIAGELTSVGGITRSGVAHINADSSLDVAFNPYIPGSVNALYLDGTTLYIGGSFSLVNSDLRLNLAAINATSGATLAWDPKADGAVNALDADASNIYAGGEFFSASTTLGFGGEVDLVNGSANINFPYVDGEIRKVISDGNNGYYISGIFTHVGGLARAGIAHINSDGSVDTNFIVTPEGGEVAQMMLFGGALYLAGSFQKINSTTRIAVASVNPTTGALNAFNPLISTPLDWGLDVAGIANDGTNIFLAGHFGTVGGTAVGGFTSIDKTTAAYDASFPEVVGTVNTIISDGSGGWFIGGDFTSVGGVTRNSLARVKSDKTLDATWNPNVNGIVYALALNGSDLFVGGIFASVGGQTRLSLAAVSASGAGAVTSFVANVQDNGIVQDLLLNAGALYVAGSFNRISNGLRNGLASIDPSTGNLNAFSTGEIDVWGAYHSMAISGTNLYVGGNFNSIGGIMRNNLAAFNLTTGALQSWNADVNNTVSKIAISGTNLYLVGTQIDSVNSVPRRGVAAVSLSTGSTTSWDPGSNFPGMVYNPMNTIIVSGSSVYVGGLFTTTASTTRSSLAEFDVTTGNLTSWYPKPSGEVTAMYVDATNVYVAGKFKAFDGTTRLGLASVNTSGVLQAWNPGGTTDSILSNGSYTDMAYYGGKIFVTGFQIEKVGSQNRIGLAEINSTTGAIGTNFNLPAFSHLYALKVSGTKLYIGGAFSNILGQARTNLAEYNLSTTSLTSFNPDLDARVTGIDVQGSTVYVAGWFSVSGGQTRIGYAAFDASTANLTSWNPIPAQGLGYSLATSATGVYLGGAHIAYGGQRLERIGKFSKATGLPDLSWAPNPNGIVNSIIQFGSLTYFGGEFTDVNSGTTRNYAAQVDASGNATAWNPNADAAVKTLFKNGSIVYMGGAFTTLGGLSRSFVGAVAYNGTGTLTTWDPSADNEVRSIVSDGTTVFLGGIFQTIGGNWSPKGAAVNASDAALMKGFINFGGDVNTVSLSGSNVYFGGDLKLMHGQSRTNLAAIDRQGNLTSWNPTTDGNVSTVSAYGSTVYVGGTFTFVNGVLPRNNLAAFNASSGAATAFTPNPDNFTIYRIYPTATAVFVIGDFNNIGGLARNYFASLNPTTGAGNSAFNPNPNQPAMTLVVNGSNIYAGGSFTSIGGLARKYLAEINATTGAATAFNPSIDGPVLALALSGTTLYIGGEYFTLAGQIRDNIGALDTTTQTTTAWAPEGPNDPYGMGMSVTDIKISGTTAVVLGYFNRIAGASRNGLAMIDLTTGIATAANPVINQSAAGVCAIEGNNVYFTGWLNYVNGKARSGFAVIDLTTGNLTY
jgi:hypothetical protein